MTLKWEQINLSARTLTLPDPKNHQPHVLPRPYFLHDLLTKRKQDGNALYVFPGRGKHGYLTDPRNQIAKVTQASGVHFILHDLRRTFITIAESLDISAYAVKRLVNHKMRNDVTAGYIVSDVERLRKPMQQIADYMLEQINLETPIE